MKEVESRCGIECSKCHYKEDIGCTGCININKPFWGECDIKRCCEAKNQNHCGECSNFPCQTLKAYAYDKEQGDNGKRIETCKKWANLKGEE